MVIQIQRKLQMQIENQGKCLQMMFEKMGDSKLKTSSSSLDGSTGLSSPRTPNDNLEKTLNQGHDKSGISSIIATTMDEECSEDASTKQKEEEETEVADEQKVGDDQLVASATKQVKSG